MAFFSRKLQGDPGKGQRAWHIREEETFAIVGTLYEFCSWLAGQQVQVKVLTDDKSLEAWTKEDFDTVSGPIGRRGRWHQFLANFQLDIIYVKGKDQTVPNVMSRWAYPAAHAASDVSIMGSQADGEGWEADDREERSWADSQVAREIPLEFVRAYSAWYRQLAGVGAARDRVRLSSVVPDCPSLRRVYEEEQSSGEIHQSRTRNLQHRFSVPSRPHRSQTRQLRTMYKNYDEQDWSYQGLVPAYACMSDSLWASSEPLTGSVPSELVQLRNLTLPPEINVLFSDWTAEYQADPYWSAVYAALRQDDPAVCPPAALESFLAV